MKPKNIFIAFLSMAILLALFCFISKRDRYSSSIFDFISVENIFNLKKEADISTFSNQPDYQKRIRFSIVSYSDPQKIYAKGNVIKKYIEDNLSVEVKIVTIRDYASLIELLKIGQVELVWAAPLIYKNIKNGINYNLLLKVLENGSSSYEGAIIVRKDSGIKSIGDLKGKSMAFVDESSTSGFYLQNKMINDLGYSSASFFSKYEFAGSHDRAIKLVYEKRFDAASVGLLPLKISGVNTEELQIIAKTKKIPNAPILANNNMDAPTRAAIYDLFMFNAKHKGGNEFIKKLDEIDKFSGFTNADTSEYEF